jgi:hypothetical protein
MAAYLWHFSTGLDTTRRRALMTNWWAIEQTFTGLPGPTLWSHVCVDERHLIPVLEVPGLSDMNFEGTDGGSYGTVGKLDIGSSTDKR